MSINRQVPKLRDVAFGALAKQGLFRTEFDMTPAPIVTRTVKIYDQKNEPVGTEEVIIDIPLITQQEGVSEVVNDMARERLFPRLLHAVINDDRRTVREMLDINPELVLLSPVQDCVVENQCTWQKFYVEDALTTAVKLKQIKMTELLLSYYEKLEQTPDVIETKRAALSTCKFYEIVNDEITIPQKYEDMAQLLIDLFKVENFPNGIPGRNDIPWNIELSDPTEFGLSCLLHFLVPKKAVKLDDHVDVELFLLAIYKSYLKNFDSFNSDWGKLDAFCIRVIGLIQSALIQETGEIFCEGLDGVVTAMNAGKEKEISARAASHKLAGGEDFYRITRDSRFGSGFEFLCGIFARAPLRPGASRSTDAPVWKNYVKQKQQVFRILCGSYSSPTNSQTDIPEMSRRPAV